MPAASARGAKPGACGTATNFVLRKFDEKFQIHSHTGYTREARNTLLKISPLRTVFDVSERTEYTSSVCQ